MGKKAILVINESLQDLKAALKKQTTLKGEKRIRALIRIKQEADTTRQDLANYLQVHVRTLERWLHVYKLDGLSQMATKGQSRNKPSKIITAAIHDGLSKKVRDVRNPLLGYWDAQRWVRSEYGLEVKYHRIREYLIQHFGTKIKSPRKSHVSKDAAAEVSFLKTTTGPGTY